MSGRIYKIIQPRELSIVSDLSPLSYISYTYVIFLERKDSGFTFDTLRNNATFAQEQAELYNINSDDPASILDATNPGIAYISLSTLVGNNNTNALVAEAAAYVSSSKSPYKAALQQQIVFLQQYPEIVSQMELIAVDGFSSAVGTAVPNETYTSFIAAQQHLLSRGTIHIVSNRSSDYPLISPNYYTVPWDVKVATAGTAYLRKIASTSPYSAFVGNEVIPGQDVDLQNYTTTNGFGTEYHPVGTASMLPRDKGGVVDSSLKVYGTSNVRVVDASIIPLHISAHLQSTVYGIAEKAADIILASKG